MGVRVKYYIVYIDLISKVPFGSASYRTLEDALVAYSRCVKESSDLASYVLCDEVSYESVRSANG